MKITFDESASDYAAESFGKTFDEQGMLVEKNNPERRVLTRDGRPITRAAIAGVYKRNGEAEFFTNDIASIVEVCALEGAS